MLHPRIRMPIWAAVALAVAAYVVRSAGRGWDFAPDLPMDAIVFGMFGVLVVLVALARRSAPADDGDEALPGQMKEEDEDPGSSG